MFTINTRPVNAAKNLLITTIMTPIIVALYTGFSQA
jgi:hypothetical protein